MQKIYFARIFGEETSDVLVRDLDGKSQVVQEILQQFCELTNRDSTRIPIQCFFEEKESKVSAILGKEIVSLTYAADLLQHIPVVANISIQARRYAFCMHRWRST